MREYATEFLPERPIPTDVADDVTRRQWLIDALASLSPRERVVIVLRYFFDMAEADVARELDLSVGTVKSLNSRGLAKLRISADPSDEPILPAPRTAQAATRAGVKR
jgi:RNA polymerase sigma factor (sigma-70 family)